MAIVFRPKEKKTTAVQQHYCRIHHETQKNFYQL